MSAETAHALELVRGGQEGIALPAISGEQMVTALAAYRGLQKSLDEAMPDQIMDLDGKQFRKKGYWRAIALAFNLTVEPIQEKREISGQFNDGRDNFGWTVTYRASHPRGRSSFGDGSCFAVEKARRFKCPHPESEGSRRTKHFPHNTCPEFDPNFQWRALPGDATEHNVRSHAHTRAFNRAVSNLVGFGEVSAEEVEREEPGHATGQAASTASSSSGSTAARGSGTPASGNTTVTNIAEKKGKNARGPWTLYTVTFADGRKGNTFSESLSQHAQNAKNTNALVNPTLEASDKGGFNLTAFEAIHHAETPKVQEPDEPVSGPENILTVRKVDTESGPRWVIQTDKRQVVTDQAGFADAAHQARADKVGLIPAFEVVPRAQGGTVNKLTSWVQAAPAAAAPATEREVGTEG